MTRWGPSLIAASGLAIAACAADNRLEVRAIADPLASAAQRGTPMIDEGRGLLALGNVGLALEAFRKARRENPNSFEALAGMAACYERMGRYDLVNTNYQAALAIAPNHPILLNSYAAALDRQGRNSEASALRTEAVRGQTQSLATAAAATAAPPKAGPPVQAPARTIAPAVSRTAVKVELPPAHSAPTVKVELPPARSAPAVTVELPPARSVTAVTVQLPPARSAPSGPPVIKQASKPARAIPQSTSSASGPAALPANPAPRSRVRLERLSPAEVALVTTDAPLWRPLVVAHSQRSATIRFVPLQRASPRPNIRLLNAARRQGLAARTRQVLTSRGWRKIDIGDADVVRARSLVLYPANRQLLGRRLAAQFGFSSALTKKGDSLVVLLGRDATAIRGRPAG